MSNQSHLDCTHPTAEQDAKRPAWRRSAPQRGRGRVQSGHQGAQIVTQALMAWNAEEERGNRLKADLLTLGGAHTIKPLGIVKTMYDARNTPDVVTRVYHGRPQNSAQYQLLEGQSVSTHDVSNHTATASYRWVWDKFNQKRSELR